MKIGYNHELCKELERLIVEERYSPDAALEWLHRYGKAGLVTICTKTLYRYIDCELFAGISNKHLPVKRNRKQRKQRIQRKAYTNLIGKSIEQRPKQVEERQEQGHWEMDCVVGKSSTKACLLVLTERVSERRAAGKFHFLSSPKAHKRLLRTPLLCMGAWKQREPEQANPAVCSQRHEHRQAHQQGC